MCALKCAHICICAQFCFAKLSLKFLFQEHFLKKFSTNSISFLKFFLKINFFFFRILNFFLKKIFNFFFKFKILFEKDFFRNLFLSDKKCALDFNIRALSCLDFSKTLPQILREISRIIVGFT